MTHDMENAKEQLIKILCTFVMHLPEEAIQGDPVYMRWMYPFERYMKKIKNYVRNKARPEGSIAEGYVAEEALTFCSMYRRDLIVPTEMRMPHFQHVSCMCSNQYAHHYGAKSRTSDESRMKTNVLVFFIPLISTQNEWYKEDQYILATQANQVFYLQDLSKSQDYWKVVQEVNHRKIWDKDIIADVIEEDVIHDNNSNDLALSANLDGLTYTSLSIGEATKVEEIPTHARNDDDDFVDDADNDALDMDTFDDEIMAVVAHGGDAGGDPPLAGSQLTYFEMKPHLDGDPTLAADIVTGVSTLCAKIYSSSNNKFKEHYFYKRGWHKCVEALRQQIPPGMKSDAWNQLLEFYINEKNVHRDTVNSANKAKQKYPSYQGSKALVENRYEQRQAQGVFPSIIETFRENHTKNGIFPGGGFAQQQYQMLALKEAHVNVPNPLTDEQIMEQVLGKRHGNKQGRGQAIRRANSTSTMLAKRARPVEGRSYTQAEVDALLAKSDLRTTRLEKMLAVLLRGLKDKNIEVEFNEVEDLDKEGLYEDDKDDGDEDEGDEDEGDEDEGDEDEGEDEGEEDGNGVGLGRVPPYPAPVSYKETRPRPPTGTGVDHPAPVPAKSGTMPPAPAPGILKPGIPGPGTRPRFCGFSPAPSGAGKPGSPTGRLDVLTISRKWSSPVSSSQKVPASKAVVRTCPDYSALVRWEPLRVSNPRSRRLDVTTTEEIRGNAATNLPVFSRLTVPSGKNDTWYFPTLYYSRSGTLACECGNTSWVVKRELILTDQRNQTFAVVWSLLLLSLVRFIDEFDV
ncbi:hypothetical protein OSB04_027727 [Centaurea solstitialis]|uniref:DUF4218 domain-containing protein n=1 Tax=Centaurea solstitialis TaxID=347529 RepID=A0AA38WAH9_9ASTR|nr:hypothetical protein OSB04_027727 [Centaurea solstitialis]